jgi:hypothetical protein
VEEVIEGDVLDVKCARTFSLLLLGGGGRRICMTVMSVHISMSHSRHGKITESDYNYVSIHSHFERGIYRDGAHLQRIVRVAH